MLSLKNKLYVKRTSRVSVRARDFRAQPSFYVFLIDLKKGVEKRDNSDLWGTLVSVRRTMICASVDETKMALTS